MQCVILSKSILLAEKSNFARQTSILGFRDPNLPYEAQTQKATKVENRAFMKNIAKRCFLHIKPHWGDQS